MKSDIIPPAILAQAYDVIAKNRNVAVKKLKSVTNSELYSALAFSLGVPWFTSADFNIPFRAECRKHASFIPNKIFKEYGFIPVSRRDKVITLASPHPWDPMLVEVIRSYFPKCEQIQFYLVTPADFDYIINTRYKAPFDPFDL